LIFRREDFSEAMAAIHERARAYFEEEVGAQVLLAHMVTGTIDHLELPKLTVLVGAEGPVSLLIAFHFDPALLDKIYLASTAGLDIAPWERMLYLREAAAETANLILGHATADLARDGSDMALSPPVVLEVDRGIDRPKRAMFATLKMKTDFGVADIHFIGPSELFDEMPDVPLREGRHVSVEISDRR